QHDAKIVREREEHLAHALGLPRPVGRGESGTLSGALQVADLAGMGDERGQRGAEERRQHLVRLAELIGGMNEKGSGTQLRRGADRGEDRCRAVGVGKHAFAGEQAASGDQRRGEVARTAGRIVGKLRTSLSRGATGRTAAFGRRIEKADDRSGSLARARRLRLHGPSRNSRTAATWSGTTSIGAWLTPANSCRRAFGPRSVMPRAVAVERTSESAPRRSSVGQRIASYAAQ